MSGMIRFALVALALVLVAASLADAQQSRCADCHFASPDALKLEAAQVDVPLKQAVVAGHAFVYDGLQERLSVARSRLTTLLEHLANPPLPARK